MIGTVAELQGWGRQGLRDADSAVLTRALTAASDYTARAIGALFSRAAVTLYLDGDSAVGRGREVLMLPASQRPVVYAPPTTPVTVSENGVALTVGVGYTPTVGVLIEYANQWAKQARLVRQFGADALTLAEAGFPNRSGWSAGRQNIEVVCTTGAETADVPADVLQVVYEVAWLIFSDPKLLGKTSTSRGSSSSAIDRGLSPTANAIIEARRL